ncbi:Transmembrane protein 98 [Aphelenchoides bicaudatus]|nr:Transmembrane protein 98 [Aphelenchoides bicaudatus]
MDVVVYLALAVLFAVFCISFGVLVVMCRRRYEYNRLLVSHSLRFSKLKHDEMDSVVQLSPHMAQTLNSNPWLFDVSGLLQHCVAVLKLCHTLTDKLAKIPLANINPQLNDTICQATVKVVPRFDDLLQTIALPNVDIRLIEARVTALTIACWSLVMPFYILDEKYKEQFGSLVREMEAHQQFLVAATQQINNASLKQAASTSHEDSPSSSTTPNPLTSTNEEDDPVEVKVIENRAPTTNGPVKETLLGKKEELKTRERLLQSGEETAPPADPLTT